MPETKANINLAWSNGVQDASLNINYISDYQHSQAVPAGETLGIDSYIIADAQYGFRVMGDALGMALGIKNLTDEKPPRVSDSANFSYDPKQHSPLGRVFYVKAKYNF
jgi:iron complex outermembrane receptor protein